MRFAGVSQTPGANTAARPERPEKRFEDLKAEDALNAPEVGRHDHAGLDRTSIRLKKRPRLDSQSPRDAGDVVDRYVALRTFDPAQVRPVDPAFMSQGQLAQALLGPEPTHIRRQDVAEWTFVRLLHRRDWCGLPIPRRPLLSYIPTIA